MARRVVSSYSTSKTVINDGKKKKRKKKTARAPKKVTKRVTPRTSAAPSRASLSIRTPTPLRTPLGSPLGTPPRFSSSPHRPYSSASGSIRLPSHLVSPTPSMAKFSPLRSSSDLSSPSPVFQKRPKPGRGPAKRAANRTTRGKKRPLGWRGRYAAATLARYARDFTPPTRHRSASPRMSPTERKRRENLKKTFNRLHYLA